MRRRLLVPLAPLVAVLALAGCASGPEAEDVDDVLATTPVEGTGEPTAEPAPFEAPDGVTVTTLDEGPVGLASVGAAYWATLPDAGEVRRADDERFQVGSLPLRLVETPAGVWLSLIGDASLALVDPGSGEVLRTVRIRPATSEPEGLAYDGSSLWVVDQAGDRVLEVDPTTGAVRGEQPTGHEPRLVTAGPTGVFVGDYSGGTVTRVVDGEAVTRNAGSCLSPQGLVEAAGVVWVACTIDGQVVGLDARTLKPVVELPGLDSADMVVADGDTVYVVGQEGPTIWTVDAKDRTVVHELALGDEPAVTENVGAALVGGSLFVSHPDARTIYEVPLRLLR